MVKTSKSIKLQDAWLRHRLKLWLPKGCLISARWTVQTLVPLSPSCLKIMSLQSKRLIAILKHQPSKPLPCTMVDSQLTKPKTTNWRYTYNPKDLEIPPLIKIGIFLGGYCLIQKVKLYYNMRYPMVDQKVVDTRVSMIGSNYWQEKLE